MPPNTAKVDRTTRWGNPFSIGSPLADCPYEVLVAADICSPAGWLSAELIDRDMSLKLFRAYLGCNPGIVELARQCLTGKNLACWCKPGDPCHGDVWIEFLNQKIEK